MQDQIGDGNFEIIGCGYDNGYKYVNGEDVISPHATRHEFGHMSVFQTVISNTKKIKFDKKLNPMCNNHTKLKEGLDAIGHEVKFVKIDRKGAYIWFRHPDAMTFKK